MCILNFFLNFYKNNTNTNENLNFSVKPVECEHISIRIEPIKQKWGISKSFYLILSTDLNASIFLKLFVFNSSQNIFELIVVTTYSLMVFLI